MPDDRIARRRMDRLVLGALCLSVLATLALAAYAYRVSERQIQATLWVNHTQDVLAALSGVRTALDDLGGAISDYIITGRERDRARYVDTLRRLTSEIARPRSLTSDNPAQQKRLDDLNTALQTLPSSMDVVPDASRSLGSSAAQRLIGITQKIDLAQALVGSAEEDERVLLHARGVEEQAAIARFRLSAAALLVLMVSALGLLYWTVRRQRAAERKWMQSEEFFHLMAASAADYGMFVLDPAGRVITWNPGAERINGYRADEIVGRHFSRFYPPEDVAGEKPARELATAAAAGEAHDEGWRVRKDGTRYWADVVITALRDESGELRGYAKLTRDMTERRQAEEALRNEVAARERIDAELKILNESLADRVAARTSELAASRDNLTREMAERMLAQELLQRSESRLRGIIESAMDAIITVDETERIVLFNSAAEAIFGCTRDEALGGPLAQFIPERFHAEHPAHIRRFGEGDGTSRRMGGQRIVTGLRRNGEEFPIDASISQAATAVGKFFTVILRDVTERVRAEEALRRSKEELRELAAIASSAREQERARIARELHDDLAQMLTALNMDLIWAGSALCRIRMSCGASFWRWGPSSRKGSLPRGELPPICGRSCSTTSASFRQPSG